MSHPNPFPPPRRRSLTRLQAPGWALLLAGLALLGGCANPPQAPEPQSTTKYTLENTDRFTALDRASQEAVACTGLFERMLADGKMEVVANLKNRGSKPVQVQANCVFKDAQGAAVVEESVWQTVTLAENATVAVRFTAANGAPQKYTIQVKEAGRP